MWLKLKMLVAAGEVEDEAGEVEGEFAGAGVGAIR